jgi:hypothetical protein
MLAALLLAPKRATVVHTGTARLPIGVAMVAALIRRGATP